MAARIRVHMVGNAHIDPVWLWRAAEGMAEVVATFRGALDRLREDKELVFTASSAFFYEWVERVAPRMFDEIRKAAGSGRWCPVGGWLIEPDCNMPSGEAFARNALYGQRYFIEKFGAPCQIGYCVDSFGHGGTLPQLLRLGGFNSYVFMRPGPHENAKIPKGLFGWEGTDGSRVLAFRIHRSYGAEGKKLLAAILDEIRRDGRPISMCFFGCGDHGGGPTRKTLSAIRELREQMPSMALLFSSPAAFFKEAKRLAGRLPVFKGELQMHSVGCYTAAAAIKAANRRAEETLLAAERLAVASCLLIGARPSPSALSGAWKDLLFNQFHDVLAGTCVKEACQEAQEHLGGAIHMGRVVMAEAAQRVAASVNTLGPGRSIFVFNTHAHPWSGLVETDDISVPERGRPETVGLRDWHGLPVPIQRVEPSSSAMRYRIVFPADLPAMGYAMFRLVPGDNREAEPVSTSAAVSVSDRSMDNGLLELLVLADATIQMRDLRRGCTVFRHGAGLPVAVRDSSDTWSHGVVRYDGRSEIFRCESVETIEAGPLRGRIRVKFRLGGSRVQLDYLLASGGLAVEVRGRVFWTRHGSVLKLRFPVAFDTDGYVVEAPYGAVARKADGRELPMNRWVAVSVGGRGLGIANCGKYGLDVQGSLINLTILRSPAYAHHVPEKFPHADQQFMDQGESEFRLALVPLSGRGLREVIREAHFLNFGPVVHWEGTHPGILAGRCGAISAQGDVWVEAVKASEDGQALIVRALETASRRTSARFSIPALGRNWRTAFRPGEVKSFRVPFRKAAKVREVDFLERPSGSRTVKRT